MWLLYTGANLSAVDLINEWYAKTGAGIKEFMSGSNCKCGAYQNIIEAIKEMQETA